ncbi:MAG: hypothetical protein RR296_10530 [Clostridia bacterium]
MNKVVSFQQDNEYLHRRADVNRRAGRLLEALLLERRAVEQAPDSTTCRMEVARTLTEMGCYVASNKVIYGALADPRAPAECYFGLCCNYFAIGQADAARRALSQFLSRDQAATARSEVRQMRDTLEELTLLAQLQNRRNAQFTRLMARAQQHDLDGDTLGALRLVDWAVARKPKKGAAQLRLAQLNIALGRWREACRAVERAARTHLRGPLLLLTAVRAYHGCGQDARARAILLRLDRMKMDGPLALRMLLEACCVLGDDARVRVLVTRVLSDDPYDCRLLHICAVNRVREGRPTEQAVSFWTRALRIDPGDAVAKYNLWLIAAERVDRNMPYDYAIPEKERAKWRRALSEAQMLPLAQLRERYHKGKQLEDKCRWALRSDDRQAMLLARALLKKLDEPATRRMLNEAAGEWMTPSDAPDDAVVSLATEKDELRVPRALKRAMKLNGYAAPGTPADFNALLEQLTLEVIRHPHWQAVNSASAWAAVLLYASSKLNGDGDMTIDQASHILEVPLRRAKRCLRLVGIKGDDAS